VSASGFADSPLSTDATDLVSTGVIQAPDFAKTGWPTTQGVTLSFSYPTFTVTDGGSAYYYIDGVKYTLSGNKTVDITDTEGLWYIYFDGATLTASQTIWSLTAENKALVAMLYWDATNNECIFIGYELHTFHMSGATHARLHYAGGARWETGLLVTDTGSETVNVSAGDIWDEDLNIAITDGAGSSLFEQVLSPAELPIYYLDGASNWRIYETTDKANATDVGYVDGSNNLHYNKLNGTWASTVVSAAKHVAYFVVATNEQTEPVALIMGQREDTTLADAKENNIFSGLTLTGLPFQEMVVLARLILKESGSGVYYTLEEVLDLRAANITGNITSPLTADHGGLAGLGDDDHPQYIKDAEFTQDSGVLVGTGSGTFAEETGATLRTSLGLAIGTDVQAYDAELASLAALSYSAASFVKMTGAATFALRTIGETADDLEATIDHDNLANGGAHDYSYISGNDGATDVTAAQLEELSDGSETTLHSHAAGAPAAHTHDGDTLQHDAVSSDAASFTITQSTGVFVVNSGTKQLRHDTSVAAGTGAIFKIGNATTLASWCAIRAVGATINQSQFQAINTAASSSSGGGGAGLYHDDGAAIATGHRLGYFLFGGSVSASALTNSAAVIAYADGNWTATSSPTYIHFEVAPSGSLTREKRLTIRATGLIGINEVSPVSLLEMTGSVPTFTIHNSDHQDTHGGRIGKIAWRGERSGGEESILAQVEAFHDETSDDEKGAIQWRTNAGSDGTSPTFRMQLDSVGYLSIGAVDPASRLAITGASSAASRFTATNTEASSASAGAGIILISDDDAAMGAGHRLGYLIWQGSSSAGSNRSAASVEAFADAAWSDGSSYSSKLLFYTTTTGATTRTVKLTIDNAGLATFVGSIASANYGATNKLTACANNAGELDFTAASKKLDVEDNAVVSQDYSSDASPTFAALSLGTGELTAGSINRASGTLTLEINGTAEISITTTTVTLGGNLIIPDSGTIGSASDTDVMTIDASGNCTFSVFPITPSAAPDADYEVANKKYVDDEVASAAGHAILDGSVHTDSVADGVTRGSIIYGNATPKWDELVIGAADTFLGSDGTDLSYRTAAQVMASLSGEAAAAFDLNGQDLTNGGVLILTEQAAAEAHAAGKGQFWVKNDTPASPHFDDDAGGDIPLDNRYVDRGDPAAVDWDQGDLTTDETWNDLDCSGIVPSNAVAICFRVGVSDDVAEEVFQMRKNGNTNGVNKSSIYTQVANITNTHDIMIVACDSSQVVEYYGTNTTWTAINVTVKGWWLA
jgi:hypothetical protein